MWYIMINQFSRMGRGYQTMSLKDFTENLSSQDNIFDD